MTNKDTQKGFSTPLAVGIAALVAIVVGAVYFTTRGPASVTMEEKKMDESAMAKPDGMMPKPEGEMGMMGGEGMMKYSGATLAGKSAPLLDFTKADYDAALKTGKLIALYFYADWCPICRAEFPVMQKVFNRLTTDRVIGFRVNYNDGQTDADEKGLAKQFGVAYQHTKVFVKGGERILKSPEGWDEQRYEAEIAKALAR